LRSSNGVVEKAPFLFVVVRDCVGPNDDNVSEFLVFCLLNRHRQKLLSSRRAVTTPSSEHAVKVCANLIGSDFVHAEDTFFSQNPFPSGFHRRHINVCFEGDKRIGD